LSNAERCFQNNWLTAQAESGGFCSPLIASASSAFPAFFIRDASALRAAVNSVSGN
jgi:hypothetical protein